ncbi:ABC transporter ATP-binding protein [Roseibium denhamense]|uniref:Iron(III) transport system ATP-binding protein n=1 Tax=Roseibium denhamense TaxID=76305 RepID=A0ABY1NJ84_9HYPH|nr:ABC transporter ATP-binding protein [Roseibium denhamense]MTI06711.1 ABC transporter ATP-binding protein [Roseibium denhamense]SMP10471.1 iron(III) transport system ATP-binding protein [Roseibium denhamense]
MTIQLSSITKSFGGHRALDNVDLQIDEGTFFVVLGPSGCGKSTLLKSIAGLEPIDAGEIRLGGRIVAGNRVHVPPEERQVGVVFQSYALWPHMSVAGNVAFPLETAGTPKQQVSKRVQDCLETVALTPYQTRKPSDLSGGQRQRVALARCLAQGASTVLMDEPLANLDPHLRNSMEEELAEFHRTSGATTVFITHDQREAMALADKVAVMWDGRILQVDDPDTLYRRPLSQRVAGFIGRSAIIPVVIQQVDGATARFELAGASVEVDCPVGTRPGPAQVLLRPDHIVLSTGAYGLPVQIVRTTYRGGHWEVFVSVEGLEEPIMMNLSRRATPGERLQVEIIRGWVLPG